MSRLEHNEHRVDSVGKVRAMEEGAPRVRPKSRKQRGLLRKREVLEATEVAFRQLDLKRAQLELEQTFPKGLLEQQRENMAPIVHGKFARVREMMSAIARRLGF